MSGHTRHQNPAFATVSDTDHTAWIAITTILCIPIILVFGVIRYAVRRTVAFGFDDGFAAAATVRSCDPIQRRLKADSIEDISDCRSYRCLERMLLWAGVRRRSGFKRSLWLSYRGYGQHGFPTAYGTDGSGALLHQQSTVLGCTCIFKGVCCQPAFAALRRKETEAAVRRRASFQWALAYGIDLRHGFAV